MTDKREEFSIKFALLFELIYCAYNMILPYVRCDKLPQSNEKLPK